MTDKKKTVSKADAIRKAAASLKAKGEKPRPTVIQKMLARDGITVAPAQVSMTLKAAGYSPLRKRAGATGDAAVTLDELIEAKQLVERFGGVERSPGVRDEQAARTSGKHHQPNNRCH